MPGSGREQHRSSLAPACSPGSQSCRSPQSCFFAYYSHGINISHISNRPCPHPRCSAAEDACLPLLPRVQEPLPALESTHTVSRWHHGTLQTPARLISCIPTGRSHEAWLTLGSATPSLSTGAGIPPRYGPQPCAPCLAALLTRRMSWNAWLE